MDELQDGFRVEEGTGRVIHIEVHKITTAVGCVRETLEVKGLRNSRIRRFRNRKRESLRWLSGEVSLSPSLTVKFDSEYYG